MYHNGKLKFEGEYLNGNKLNGKGYNINGNVEYEINDGKGKIKLYNSEDEILFEGEYINGKLNGKGRINYFENELIFEGEFMKGIILNAKLYYVNNNLEYEIKNGKGNIKYLFSGSSKYEGN